MIARETLVRSGRTLLGVLTLAFVALFVVQAVPGLVGAEHSYVVLTGSMEPAINPGDSVIVDEVAPEEVRTGDVITFRDGADDPPVTHRVVEVVETDGEVRYRTAGDNNDNVDAGLVHPDDLIGKVWFTIPFVGYVTQFANTPAGAAVLVGVPIALLVLSELWVRSGPVVVTSATSSAHSSGADVPPSSDRDAADESPTAGVAPAGSSTDGAEPVDAPSTDENAISLGTTDLALGTLGFGSFTVYATYVAFQDTTGVSVGAAVTAGIATAFHLTAIGLLTFSGPEEGPTPAGDVPETNTDEPVGGGSDD